MENSTVCKSGDNSMVSPHYFAYTDAKAKTGTLRHSIDFIPGVKGYVEIKDDTIEQNWRLALGETEDAHIPSQDSTQA